jgi:DNA ligase-associated metallophosphoesterase
MQSECYKISFKGEDLMLLPEKAIWFPKYETLLVSDTHLGKGSHFRKAGIAVPTNLEQADLATLSDIIADYKPKELIFLGDLFHSDINNDWEWFKLWRQLHQKINMVLIKGNHDILPLHFYQLLNIEIVNSRMLGVFELFHDLPKQKTSNYIISGHIHPGIKLNGKARQKMVLPCFYFGEHYSILPAFGKFTGKAMIKRKENDLIYAIAGKNIIAV